MLWPRKTLPGLHSFCAGLQIGLHRPWVMRVMYNSLQDVVGRAIRPDSYSQEIERHVSEHDV